MQNRANGSNGSGSDQASRHRPPASGQVSHIRCFFGQDYRDPGKYADRPSPEQDVVLMMRAEDLERAAAAKETAA